MEYSCKRKVVRELKRITTKSGEIVAVFENELKLFENENAYQVFMNEYIEKQELDNAYREMFYFDIKGIRYGYPIFMKNVIVSTIEEHIKKPEERVELLLQLAEFTQKVFAK